MNSIWYLHQPYRTILIQRKRKKNAEYIEKALDLGKTGIKNLCDDQKIQKILSLPIDEHLWDNTELKNPCASGMLPYYIGFTIYQTGKNKSEASKYYQIASMNDDGPKASRILSIIAKWADGDHISSAMNFLLLGANGYDTKPYQCRSLAEQIIRYLWQNYPVDARFVSQLEKNEQNLVDTKNEKDTASQATDNCYDMTTRGIKELYLQYITNSATGTLSTDATDLIKLWKIQHIPTLSKQKNFTVRKINGIWQYREK